MKGAARAAKRRTDEAVSLAWHTAAFGAAAMNGKLKKLGQYLKPERAKAQSPEDMLEALRSFQARGAPMNIRQVH